MKVTLSKISEILAVTDPLSRILFYLAIAGIILQAAIIAWSWGKLPPVVPLLYSLPWGEGRLVEPRFLVSLAIASGGVVVVNNVAGCLVKDTTLVRILASASFIISFLVSITLAKIVVGGLP